MAIPKNSTEPLRDDDISRGESAMNNDRLSDDDQLDTREISSSVEEEEDDLDDAELTEDDFDVDEEESEEEEDR